MEYQDNEKLKGPSKAFIKRGAVATSIIALILIVQTSWFQKIFSKDAKNGLVINEDTTVGEVVTKDSNGNGITDWQERMWGLDPTVAFTNGVSNKTIIEEKRKSLQGASTNNNLNETDLLAQQLYGVTTALSQSTSINSTGLNQLGSDLGESFDIKEATNEYGIKDIKTIKTTAKSLNSYYNSVKSIISKYTDEIAELDIVINALETQDFSQISQLTQKSIEYKSLSKSLKDISVPVGVADYHLAIINSLYGMGEALFYLSQIEDNGINALSGISIYKTHSLIAEESLIKMNNYFISYGIINE